MEMFCNSKDTTKKVKELTEWGRGVSNPCRTMVSRICKEFHNSTIKMQKIQFKTCKDYE